MSEQTPHLDLSEPLITDAELATATREPMGTIRGWMADFGALGATTGLAMVVTNLLLYGGPAQNSLLSFLLLGPVFIGLAGAVAGAVSGLILRTLRGTVSAAWGVFLAAMGTNFVGSMLTMTAHDLFHSPATEVIVGQAAPLSLAIWALIPLVAVLRWKRQSTLPWMVLFGTLAGILIGL